jgi:hypothetical protein
LGIVGTAWQIAGVGNFNGDVSSGHPIADILWRNADGDVAIWFSNGSGGFINQDLGIVSTDWQIAGVGDFNGNGRSDIAWRNLNGETAIWNSNPGPGFTGFTNQTLGVESGWQMSVNAGLPFSYPQNSV